MAQKALIAALLTCALAATAWAAEYNDDTDGDWNADATWITADGVDYPQAGDDAIIDSNVVTVPSGYVIPATNLIDIQTGGTLSIMSGVQTPTITMHGGVLQIPNAGGISAVTLTGPLNVDAGGGTLICPNWYTAGMKIQGPIVSTTTAAATLAVQSISRENETVRLEVASPDYAGQWDVQVGLLNVLADGALGTGTASVGGGGSAASLFIKQVNQSGTGPAAIEVKANGTLQLRGALTVDWDNDPVTTLNGGRLLSNDWEAGNITWSDPIHVAASSTIANVCSNLYLDGDLSGVPGATLYLAGNRNGLYLNGSNSGFLGDIEITNASPPGAYENRARVYVVNGALGGAADVTVKDEGMIAFTEDYTSSLPPVTAEADGRIELRFSRAKGAFSGDLTLDGGILTNQGYGNYYDSEMSGELTVASGSFIQVSGESNANLYISGTITGAGKLTQTSGGRTLYMTGTASSWTGGAEVQSGTMQIESATALGSGSVTVNGSGILRTYSPAKGAVLGACPAVVAESGGIIKINSTEADTTKLILNPLGGLWIEGGSTQMDYGAGGNIVVHTGAILHEDIDGTAYPYPDLADIIPDGQGQKYLWKGAASFAPGAATTYTMGLGAGVVLEWKGLAAMSTDCTMNANVTVQEFNAGSGFSLFSPGGYFHLGGEYLAAGPTFNGSGNVELQGAGAFILWANAFNGTITTLDYKGTGFIQATRAAAMTAGQTLNVHAGSNLYFHHQANKQAFGTSDDPGDFATVNILEGGMVYTNHGVYPTRGTFNVKSGGAISADADWPAGAVLNFDPGSQLVRREYDFTTQLPTDGNANFVLYHNGQLGSLAGGINIVLNDDTRLTGYSAATGDPAVNSDSGDLVLAGGASQGRIAAPGGLGLWLSNRINIPSGTLIVNSTGTFRAATGMNQWTDLAQDGIVYLQNESAVPGTANVIEKMDIQAGTVIIGYSGGTAAASLGGADVHIASGAMLQFWRDATTITDQTISGSGTIYGSGHYHWICAGSTLNPGQGAAAGILRTNMNGWDIKGTKFVTGGAANNAQLVMDIVGDGGAKAPAEGTDYDQLDVQSMEGFPNADFTVRIPVPSADFHPDNLAGQTLTVLKTTIDLSALETGADGWASVTLDTIGDANNHWGGNINYENLAMTVTDLVWNGFGGDADLNGVVNYLDLGILATNYDLTGMGWGDGDSNLDGKVDYMDLGILATNYDLTEPGGAAPVPAPGAVFLLAFGAVGLLRRRR